ncbi:MAG: hypothetical protein M5R40_18860 [Anaerolineae bacterium]|nr:hypothetical protein [Anaerolineae bacterium]
MNITPKVGFLPITWPGLYTAASETGEAWIQEEDTLRAQRALEAAPLEVVAHGRVVAEINEAFAAVDRFLGEDVDCMVIFVQTWNWADRILQAAQRFGRPIMLWAMPIARQWSIGGLAVTHGSMDEVGIPHKVTYGLPDQPGIVESIVRFARAAYVKNALTRARFGSIGGHGMGIYTGPIDPAQWLREFGVSVGYVDQYEVVAAGEQIPQDEIRRYYEETLKAEYGAVPPLDEVTTRSIRLYLALEQVIAREKFDFTGVNDMFALSDNYCTMCLAQSRLGVARLRHHVPQRFEWRAERVHPAPAQRRAAVHRRHKPRGQGVGHRPADRRRRGGDHAGAKPEGREAQLPAQAGGEGQRRLHRPDLQAGAHHAGADGARARQVCDAHHARRGD